LDQLIISLTRCRHASPVSKKNKDHDDDDHDDKRRMF
jgi:hypothetical protein